MQDQKHKFEIKQTGLVTRRAHLEEENAVSRDRLAAVIEKISGLKTIIAGVEYLRSQGQEATVLGIQRSMQQVER